MMTKLEFFPLVAFPKVLAAIPLSVLLACGNAPPTSQEMVDASTVIQLEDAAQVICAEALPAEVEMSQGGVLRLAPEQVGAAEVESRTLRIYSTAKGIRVRAPIHARDGELQLRCGSVTRTVVVRVRPLGWRRLASWNSGDGPPAREYGAMWYERGTDRLMLLGGFGYLPRQFSPLSDLWSFSLSDGRWQALMVTGDTVAMAGIRVASQADGTTRLLGGGFIEGRSVSTPARFRSLSADYVLSALPSSRATHPSYTGSLFVHQGRFYSVGGANAENPGASFQLQQIDDEHSLDVAVAGVAPSARMGFHYGYDPESETLWVFGGQPLTNRPPTDELFSLSLRSEMPRWTQHEASGTPRGRRNGAFAFDEQGSRLFLWGGTTDGINGEPGLDILTLDPDGPRWEHIDVEAPARAGASAAVLDGQMVFGFGNNAEGQFMDLYALSL